MNEKVKFWTQTLITPLIIALVGAFINNTLQEQQRNMDKIKLTEQIFKEAIDSNNPDKAFALAGVIPHITNDEKLSGSLVKLINDYYAKIGIQAARDGNDSLYNKISSSAKEFKGSGVMVNEMLAKNPVVNKVESARVHEQKGLTYLQEGKFEEAKASFESAEKTYPGLHSNYEISKLIGKKLPALEQGADKNVVKDAILDTIKRKYSWKLKDILK